MKKRSEVTQTPRAGCSKAELNTFAPPQTPFTGARDGQNLISWRQSLPLPTDPVWWGSMQAISSYRGNRPTNKQTTHKQTGPITIHCAAKLSAQCKKRSEATQTLRAGYSKADPQTNTQTDRGDYNLARSVYWLVLIQSTLARSRNFSTEFLSLLDTGNFVRI